MESSDTSNAKPAGLVGVLSRWSAVWGITALFVVAGLALGLGGRALHDEGVLTWHYASILAAEPVAGLFFQKLRPVLALVYAPVALLGFRAFVVFHVLVAAAAIPLSAAIAAKLGQRQIAVPALVLATSPLLLMTAAGGHSNADLVTGLLLGLFLIHVRDRPVAGGAVLGALLLVRSEVAPMLAVIAAGELVVAWRAADNPSREARLAALKTGLVPGLAMAIVPVVYVLLGVLYHRDLLWALHYPPTLTAPADSTWVESGDLPRRLVESGEALLALSPAWGLALLLRPRALVVRERWIGLGVAVCVVLLRGLPMIGLFNFDTSPRYLMVALPGLALILGRQLEGFGRHAGDPAGSDDGDGTRPAAWAGVVSLLLLGLLAALAFDTLQLRTERGAAPPLLAFVGVWALCLALSFLRPRVRPMAVTVTWVVAGLSAAPLLGPGTGLVVPRRTLDGIATWWVESGAQADGLPVITNFPLTRPWLEHEGLLDDPDRVQLMLQHDMVHELDALLDAEVGQDEAILRALDSHFYGRPILGRARDGSEVGEGRHPRDWSEGSVVIFVDDERLDRTIDLELWHRHLDIEVQQSSGGNEGLLIGRIVHWPRPPAEEGSGD